MVLARCLRLGRPRRLQEAESEVRAGHFAIVAPCSLSVRCGKYNTPTTALVQPYCPYNAVSSFQSKDILSLSGENVRISAEAIEPRLSTRVDN